MGQQMAKGDVAFSVNSEVMKKARQPIVQAHLGVARQHHHGHGGGKRFGQRGEIENGFEPHRRTIRHDRAKAKGSLVCDIAADAHDQRRTGNRALFNRLREGSFDLMPSQAATPFFVSSRDAFARSRRLRIKVFHSSNSYANALKFALAPKARQLTAGSITSMRRPPLSSFTRTPNGSVMFSVPLPASIPNSTGHSRPAVCSA